MPELVEYWPILAGLIPAAIAYGALHQKVNGHVEKTNEVHAEIKGRLEKGDQKLDDLLVAVTKISTDIEWMMRNEGRQ